MRKSALGAGGATYPGSSPGARILLSSILGDIFHGAFGLRGHAVWVLGWSDWAKTSTGGEGS